MKKRVGAGRRNKFPRLGSMIAVRSLMFVGMIFMSCLAMKGEIIGDTIVAVKNNLAKGDTVKYDIAMLRLRITGNDTVPEGMAAAQSKIVLSDVLDNGDKIFEMIEKLPELGSTGVPEGLDKLLKQLYSVASKPQQLLTDSLGEVKDICNYEELKMEADTCFKMLEEWVDALDVEEEQKSRMKTTFKGLAEQSMSKESIMEKIKLFQFYGGEYELDTTLTYDIRVTVPFLGNQEVDATVDFTCSLLEQRDDYELVSFQTDVVYNSDQLMDLVKEGFLTEAQIQASGLLDPERPYVSITETAVYEIEVISGKVMKYEDIRRVNTPDGGNLNYTVMQASN